MQRNLAQAHTKAEANFFIGTFQSFERQAQLQAGKEYFETRNFRLQSLIWVRFNIHHMLASPSEIYAYYPSEIRLYQEVYCKLSHAYNCVYSISHCKDLYSHFNIEHHRLH